MADVKKDQKVTDTVKVDDLDEWEKMKALCWHGTNDVRVENVPDPQIQDSRDAVIKITSTAICGSDLHLVNGFQPTMEAGDVLGHENMGEVVEVGQRNHEFKGWR